MDETMEVDEAPPRKLVRRKKSNHDLVFIKRKSSQTTLHIPGVQHINNMTQSDQWNTNTAGLLDTLSSKQTSDVAKADLKSIRRRSSLSAQNPKSIKASRQFEERHNAQSPDEVREALSIVRKAALNRADTHEQEAWAVVMDKISKDAEAHPRRAKALQGHLRPKVARDFDVYRDDSNDDNTPTEPIERVIDDTVLRLAHSNVDAQVFVAIRLSVYFLEDGKTGHLLPPFGIDASQAPRVKDLVKHIEAYEPFSLHVVRNAGPRQMRFTHDNPYGAKITRYVDMSSDSTDEDQVDEAYDLFLKGCRELGVEKAKVVAEGTNLKRRKNQTKLRGSKFELDGMKERNPKEYDVPETGAEVSGHIRLVF